MSLWFITPAFRRYALSAVCFDQRLAVIGALMVAGVEARCVVVADDENLDLARARGFDTVETPNRGPDNVVWLGRKFNDGIEYAARHGAMWIVPIGSDSWVDPEYFLPLPESRFTRTSRYYSVVEHDRLGELSVHGRGAGPFMFHRDLLARSGFRPAEDARKRSIDSSTVRGIIGSGGRLWWEPRDLHPLQYVGFRGTPTISPYSVLYASFGRREHADPWALLAAHYPADLVERARAALEPEEVAA